MLLDVLSNIDIHEDNKSTPIIHLLFPFFFYNHFIFIEFCLLFILFNSLIVGYYYFTLHRIDSKNLKWSLAGQDSSKATKNNKHHHHPHNQRDGPLECSKSTASTDSISDSTLTSRDENNDLDNHRVDRSKSFALEHNQMMNFNAYNNLIVSSYI